MENERVIIGICDDEEHFILQLRRYCVCYLQELGVDYEFVIMHTGDEVLQYEGETMDLLFLDIEMPGVDGISVMQRILHWEKVWRIVFVSSHEEYVYDAFGLKTLGFERKPVREDKIKRYLQCAWNERKRDVIIRFKKNDEDAYLHLSDIYYIKAEGAYIRICSKEKQMLVAGKLAEWEKKLSNTSIMRIHKSYLVNLEYI